MGDGAGAAHSVWLPPGARVCDSLVESSPHLRRLWANDGRARSGLPYRSWPARLLLRGASLQGALDYSATCAHGSRFILVGSVRKKLDALVLAFLCRRQFRTGADRRRVIFSRLLPEPFAASLWWRRCRPDCCAVLCLHPWAV